MKKSNLKKILAGIFTVGLLASPAHALELHDTGLMGDGRPIMKSDMPITIHLDGKYLPTTDVDPTIMNGRTMIPLRLAGEALGANVTWNSLTRGITVTKDSSTINFYLNSTTYYINDVAHKTDVSPTIMSGRTMLPLRVFAEALNAEVTWDNTLYDVSIDTAAPNASPVVVPNGTNADAAIFVKKYYVHPDANDLFVGSWALSKSDDITKAGGAKFISKLNDDIYQMVTLGFDDQWNGPVTTIDVNKNDALGTACEDSPMLSVYNTQNYIYYIGSWFHITPWADTYDDYTYVDGQLFHYQSTNISDGTSYFYSDFYSKF